MFAALLQSRRHAASSLPDLRNRYGCVLAGLAKHLLDIKHSNAAQGAKTKQKVCGRHKGQIWGHLHVCSQRNYKPCQTDCCMCCSCSGLQRKAAYHHDGGSADQCMHSQGCTFLKLLSNCCVRHQ
jgi:hypothetical protein